MRLRWGILGTGSIAGHFAKGMRECGSGALVAVGSRSQESAERFANEHGGQPYASYQSVLDRPEVEAVYIALPHHLHSEWTIRAAEAGKHVLCEKPFALNLEQAEAAIRAARKADVFLMEAFMYRCHPQTTKLMQLLQDGAIGTPLALHAEFGYRSPRKWDHFKAYGPLGGGGLMDVGCYCVSLAVLLADAEPRHVHYSCARNDSGADVVGVGTLAFESGFQATFATGIGVELENRAVVFGEAGRLVLDSPWFCRGPLVLHRAGKDPEAIPVDSVCDLWGHQAELVARYLDERECPLMPLRHTLQTMSALDRLRACAGLRFEAEGPA